MRFDANHKVFNLKELPAIAVDLTPLLPHGTNGGVKPLAISLAKSLSQTFPHFTWSFLTADDNHDEFSFLESANARRVCVVHRVQTSADNHSPPKVKLKTRLGEWATKSLPSPAVSLLKSVYRKLLRRSSSTVNLPPLPITSDLLFCPLTGPQFYNPNIPIVSVVHDLQYLYYPQFFEAEARYYRDLHFRQAAKLAARLVCDSNYVRDTVLANTDVNPSRVVTIYPRAYHRLPNPSPLNVEQALRRYNLTRDTFLLYPANFWQHKNHEMLLTALGIYFTAHPDSNLRLVCSGMPGERMLALQSAARRMGLAERIIFPGYISDSDLAVLMSICRALIFPSLYEGFGMPILEAMAFDKPVLCSNVTSLPEVAGGAASLFDPRRPDEIAHAIHRITTDANLAAQLVERGRARLKALGGETQMAKEYRQLFEEVLQEQNNRHCRK